MTFVAKKKSVQDDCSDPGQGSLGDLGKRRSALHLPDGRRVEAEQECVPEENTSGGRLNFILILFRLWLVHPV